MNTSTDLKFGDGDGPNLCRVKKQMLVPHLLIHSFTDFRAQVGELRLKSAVT